MRFSLFLPALLACVASAVELDTTTYSLSFTVARGEFERARADVGAQKRKAAAAAGTADLRGFFCKRPAPSI